MDSRLTISDFLLPIAVCVSAGMFGAAGYFAAVRALEALGVMPPGKENGKGGDVTKYIGGDQ
jgi:hypothetical protein